MLVTSYVNGNSSLHTPQPAIIWTSTSSPISTGAESSAFCCRVDFHSSSTVSLIMNTCEYQRLLPVPFRRSRRIGVSSRRVAPKRSPPGHLSLSDHLVSMSSVNLRPLGARSDGFSSRTLACRLTTILTPHFTRYLNTWFNSSVDGILIRLFVVFSHGCLTTLGRWYHTVRFSANRLGVQQITQRPTCKYP